MFNVWNNVWKPYATDKIVIAATLLCLFLIVVTVILALYTSGHLPHNRNKTVPDNPMPDNPMPDNHHVPITAPIAHLTEAPVRHNENTAYPFERDLEETSNDINNNLTDLEHRVSKNQMQNSFLTARQDRLKTRINEIIDKDETNIDNLTRQTNDQLADIETLAMDAERLNDRVSLLSDDPTNN